MTVAGARRRSPRPAAWSERAFGFVFGLGSRDRRVLPIVSAAALALALAACSAGSDNESNSIPQLPTALASTLSTQDSMRLHQALTNRKPAAVGAVLAAEVKAAYLKTPHQLLPAGSKLEILSDKMLVSGDTATVQVTVTGGASAGTYLLVLEKQGGKWFLVGTEKQ